MAQRDLSDPDGESLRLAVNVAWEPRLKPINLRQKMQALISREIEHQRNGEKGRIIFKMNSLVDKGVIRLLYEASQAGVSIDLIVRGICCLRPGVPGISENIRVRSVVGRFLEHSRIYYFGNKGDDVVYLGSADMMPRNLDRRVEVLFPIEDPEMGRHVRESILTVWQADNVKARLMQSDGSFVRPTIGPDDEAVNSQQYFLDLRASGSEE